MNERSSFYRKIGYGVAIALLLLPLSILSMPASGGKDGSAGGVLARQREKYKLSQTNLGEIDPASETMKLGSVGLRGVAVAILWNRANEYKKTEDWTNFSATLEQIIKLQPNFINVWKFQAWNLSYNVSVEFDDYNDRYRWVIRGIDFLKDGIEYNEDDPQLLWDLGWFIGHKIGRADEHKQFRRLFKEDDDFHPSLDIRPMYKRDNWLVANEWFKKSEDAVKYKGKRMKGKGPLIFHSDPAMALMNYAEAIEDEGVFGDTAEFAWKDAGRAWNEYGAIQMPSSYGVPIHLNNRERREEEAAGYAVELEALLPGVRETLQKDREASLTPEEKAALLVPPRDRNEEEYRLAQTATEKLGISLVDLAERIGKDDPEQGDEASRLARLGMRAARRAEIIRRYRQIVNFEYWRTRAEMEQTENALTAREEIYKGDRALDEADLLAAKDHYDKGMALWRNVLDDFPLMADEGTTGDDLLEVVKRYRRILDEIDEPFPSDFVLRDVIEKHDREGQFKDLLPPRLEGEGDVRSPDGLPSVGRPPEPPAE